MESYGEGIDRYYYGLGDMGERVKVVFQKGCLVVYLKLVLLKIRNTYLFSM